MKLPSNRTYILPTSLGAVLILFTVLAFVIAVTFGHPFSYFITFFSVSIIIVCAFYTNYSIENLKTFYFKDEFIESNKAGEVSINISLQELKNPLKVISKGELQCESRHSILNKSNSQFKVSIDGGACGIKRFPRIRIQSTYPLGIYKAWKYIESSRSLIIYPTRISSRALEHKFNLGDTLDIANNQCLDTKDEFLEHRSFRDTDSWKHIDWKAYARGRGLLTKSFSSNSSNILSFAVFSHSTLKYLGEVTNALFLNYELSRKTILIVDGKFLSKGRSQSHLYKCLRVLAQIGEDCE